MGRKVELLTKTANCLRECGWDIKEIRDIWYKCLGDEVFMKATFIKMRNGGNQVVENIIDYCKANFGEPWLNKVNDEDAEQRLSIAKDILLKLLSNTDVLQLTSGTQNMLIDASVSLANGLMKKIKES